VREASRSLVGLRPTRAEKDALRASEFVPQWPSDNNSVNHVRRKGQCGTNCQ